MQPPLSSCQGHWTVWQICLECRCLLVGAWSAVVQDRQEPVLLLQKLRVLYGHHIA